MTATTNITPDQTLIRRARCPRCGYDLRGAVATWSEQCPLRGTCAECGLQFVWAEVLHPEKFEPQWCVEFVPGMRRIVRASSSTLIHSFWPFGFWRDLKMSMPIRWRRLLAYMTFLLIPVLIGYATIQTIAAVRVRYDVQQKLDEESTEFEEYLALYQPSLAEMIENSKQMAQRLNESIEELRSSAPLDERSEIMIGRIGALLAEIEAAGGVDVWAEQQARAEDQQRQALANLTVGVDLSYLGVVAEAVFLPWKDSSAGTITALSGVAPYIAPREIQYEFFLRFVDRYPSSFQVHAAYSTLAALGLGIWLWILFPFTFILLPVSRRRAKVRWGHVLRVSCYASSIPSVILTGSLIALGIGYVFDDLRPEALAAIRLVGRYVMIPMLILWWATAIKRYLCIPHSWAVVVLLSSMLSLVFLALLWAVFDDLLFELW